MSMIDNDWLPAIKEEYSKPYYKELFTFVKDEYSKYVVYPPADDIFNAFHFTPLSKVKVLILGQDPYHNNGQAHGLCFSVKPDVEIPPRWLIFTRNYKMTVDAIFPIMAIWKMGKRRRDVAEYCTDCACSSGKFPQRNRMGRITDAAIPGVE